MARKRPDALARRRSSYPTASLAPESAASASRCGHSISTGATARNSGPGKSPLLPMRASPIASSATMAAMRSPSSVEQNGSNRTEAAVPALRVLIPSAPPSPHRLARRHALAAPVADGGHCDPVERTFILPFHAGGVRRREQLFATQRERGKRDVHGKLRLEAVPEEAARRAHRHLRQSLKPGALLVGRGLRAGGTRDHAGVRRWRAHALPNPPKRGRHCAGWSSRALRQDPGESRQGLGVARLGMAARLQNEECAERAEHHACLPLPVCLLFPAQEE